MKNQSSIRERFLRDPLAVRLGGLAANLARVKSFSDHPEHCAAVERLVDESKYFIEWTATDANLDLQVELVELQRQLAAWQLDWRGIWSDPARRAAVAERAGLWSGKILNRSGLL